MSDQLKQFIMARVESDKVSLANIKNGAAVEMFDRALDKVIRNIADVNTTLRSSTALDLITYDQKGQNR